MNAHEDGFYSEPEKISRSKNYHIVFQKTWEEALSDDQEGKWQI